MGNDIFIEEYKNIKEVDINSLNSRLINLNHEICEAKKGLKCLKSIKRTQLKYRVFKRKKSNFSRISNSLIDEYAKAHDKLFCDNISGRKLCEAKNKLEIVSYELALINDESREYEYNSKLDEAIDIYKSDIHILKNQKRRLVLDTLRTQLLNYKTIKRINKIETESIDSENERRVLRRFLR